MSRSFVKALLGGGTVYATSLYLLKSNVPWELGLVAAIIYLILDYAVCLTPPVNDLVGGNGETCDRDLACIEGVLKARTSTSNIADSCKDDVACTRLACIKGVLRSNCEKDVLKKYKRAFRPDERCLADGIDYNRLCKL